MPDSIHTGDAGHLTCEQLLFLSAWRPVETDTRLSEGDRWTCLNCSGDVAYFRTLARLEGEKGQCMVQCPLCDHLHVVRLTPEKEHTISVEYGGPHIDRFLAFLDRRNAGRD